MAVSLTIKLSGQRIEVLGGTRVRVQLPERIGHLLEERRCPLRQAFLSRQPG